MNERSVICVGERFGNLVVTAIFRDKDRYNHPRIYCDTKCDCGNTKTVDKHALQYARVKSCGCLNNAHKMRFVEKSTTHGQSGTRLYELWCGIKQRCYYPNCDRYNCYGGRGIKVCDEWKDDFLVFHDWAVTHGYENSLSIERKNVDGDYCPDNCCFIPLADQHKNKRNTKHITCFGQRKTLSDWAKDERCLVDFANLRHRLHLGWDIERALTKPLRRSTVC
jgi:hypothetical protein